MITQITKHYAIQENGIAGHQETDGNWTYHLLKDGMLIDSDDHVKGLQFPNNNVRFQVLDFYGFQNHQKTKEYKKWKRISKKTSV